jgi:hypothetical protein
MSSSNIESLIGEAASTAVFAEQFVIGNLARIRECQNTEEEVASCGTGSGSGTGTGSGSGSGGAGNNV